MKLASIRIVTKNVSALAKFYEDLLGVAAVGDEDFVEFEVNGSTLVFCSQNSVTMFNAGAAIGAANRTTILEFEVENVDSERSRLTPIVKQWVQEPTDQPWGNRSMLFRDPDGNLINLYTAVH